MSSCGQPILKQIARVGSIAEQVQGETLATLVVSKLRGPIEGLRCAFDYRRRKEHGSGEAPIGERRTKLWPTLFKGRDLL